MSLLNQEGDRPQENPWSIEIEASTSISVKGVCPTCKYENTTAQPFNYVLLFDINRKAHPDNKNKEKKAAENSIRLGIEFLLVDHHESGCEGELTFPTDNLLSDFLE